MDDGEWPISSHRRGNRPPPPRYPIGVRGGMGPQTVWTLYRNNTVSFCTASSFIDAFTAVLQNIVKLHSQISKYEKGGIGI
jgi:hypothetical protein